MPVSPGLAGTPFADNPASPWGNAPPAIASWLTQNWGTPGFDTATVGGGLGAAPGAPNGAPGGAGARSVADIVAQYQGRIPMGGGSPAPPPGWTPPTGSASWRPGMNPNPTRMLLSGRTPVAPPAPPPAPVVPPGAAAPGAAPGAAPPGLGGLFGNMNNSAPPGSLIAALMAMLRGGGGFGGKTGMPMGMRGMMQGPLGQQGGTPDPQMLARLRALGNQHGTPPPGYRGPIY